MPRLKFIDVQDRFGHIDARFISSNCNFNERTATYTVEIYPWWEHPRYLEAREAGGPWGFGEVPDAAYKRATVHAIGLFEAHLSPQDEVIDWWVTQRDPRLWPYEEWSSITCNQPLTLSLWLDILESVRAELKLRCLTPLLEVSAIEQIHRHGASSAFCLGNFPYSVYVPLRKQLEARRIDLFDPREPEPKELPFLFVAGGDDYLIAEDFEIDLPEFEHRDEWFQA